MSESQPGSGMASGAILRPSARITGVRVEPKGFGIRNENEKGQRDGGQRYRKYLR